MLGWLFRRSDRRPRSRLAGCLLWILALIVLLVVASLLFGGFQKGTKAAGAGPPLPGTPVAANSAR
jgi:heme A synthase